MVFDRAIKGYAKFILLMIPWLIIFIPLKIVLDLYNVSSDIQFLVIMILIIILACISLKLFDKNIKKN